MPYGVTSSEWFKLYEFSFQKPRFYFIIQTNVKSYELLFQTLWPEINNYMYVKLLSIVLSDTATLEFRKFT